MGLSTIKEEKNIKYGVILSYIGMFISIIGSFFITRKIVTYIGDYYYGIYAFVESIAVWLSVVSTALNASFVKYASIEAKKNNNDVSFINSIYFKLFMFLSVFILTVSFLIIWLLYRNNIELFGYSLSDSRLIYLLFILSVINISLNIATSTFSLFLSFKKQFIFEKMRTIVLTICNYLFHFFIAFYTRNIIYISIYTIISTLVIGFINFYYAKKYFGFEMIKVSLKENKGILFSIISFSSIIVFNAVIDKINDALDLTLLGIFSRPEDVTIYQLGDTIRFYLSTMSVSISSVFIPKIYELYNNSDNRNTELSNLYLNVSHIQLFVLCLITFGFIICGKEFVVLWMGQERIGIYYVSSILMFISICPLSINMSIEIQRAMNKHRFRAFAYFAFGILNVVLSIIFINCFNNKIFACLLGTIIARILSHWISMNVYNAKVIKLPIKNYLIEMFKYIAIGAISCVIVYLLSFSTIIHMMSTISRFFIKGTLFVILYILIILLFDRVFFINLLKKVLKNL